jgi:hypothetical protein
VYGAKEATQPIQYTGKLAELFLTTEKGKSFKKFIVKGLTTLWLGCNGSFLQCYLQVH